MNIIVSTFPDPDIPAPLLALVKAHSLKQKNVDQLLERSGEPDLATLALSPFLDEYRNAVTAIENNPVTKMLQGEALHHAALIDIRQRHQTTVAMEKSVDAGRSETSQAVTKVVEAMTTG